MELIKLAAVGFALGITAVIPGFSVATMAVVFNVYDRLINIIVPSVRKILAAWLFWLPMAAGGIAGIIFSSKVFTILFENYYIPTYWFFIGVIAGSIPLVYSRVLEESSRQKKAGPAGKFSKLPSLSSIICCVLAAGVMVFMAVIKPQTGAALYTEPSPSLIGLLVFAGALAATAMIIPGISGSFLLLVIGLYPTVLRSVSDLNLPLMLPVLAGAVIGLLLSAAFVRFLLKKAPNETYGAVLGLVAGSILVLYPGGFGEGAGVLISVLCLVTGFLLSFLFGSRKH